MIPADALDWIHQQVKNVVSVEVAQQWALSTVLRVRTTRASVYFKACHPLPLSADEPRLTACLARLYPADLPEVLAVDAGRGWLLLGDVGAILRDQPQFERWHQALLRLAQIQGDSIPRLDLLEAAGCPDRRPARLADQIDSLLASDAVLVALRAGEADRLRARAPLLRANAQALALTALVHGDFYGANIGWQDGALRFFDWSESCLAHPLFDLPVILRDAAAHFPAEQVDLLRDDYLACWEDGARQWRIAAPVAALHHAMMYNGVAEVVAPDKPRVRVAGWLREILTHAP